MERLWAPWRKAYIRPKTKIRGCLFCRLLAQNKDSRTYILKRSSKCFAILNLYPYNNGHVLILPKRHTAKVSALTSEEKLDWLNLYQEVEAALQKTVKPHGFNIGINLGRTAGAGIPGHLHLHIVPRWKGDSNFMPVTGGAKVISESLDSIYQLLTSKLKSPKKRSR